MTTPADDATEHVPVPVRVVLPADPLLGPIRRKSSRSYGGGGRRKRGAFTWSVRMPSYRDREDGGVEAAEYDYGAAAAADRTDGAVAARSGRRALGDALRSAFLAERHALPASGIPSLPTDWPTELPSPPSLPDLLPPPSVSRATYGTGSGGSIRPVRAPADDSASYSLSLPPLTDAQRASLQREVEKNTGP